MHNRHPRASGNTRLGRVKRLFTTATTQYKMLWRRVSQNKEQKYSWKRTKTTLQSSRKSLKPLLPPYYDVNARRFRDCSKSGERAREPNLSTHRVNWWKSPTITGAYGGSAGQKMKCRQHNVRRLTSPVAKLTIFIARVTESELVSRVYEDESEFTHLLTSLQASYPNQTLPDKGIGGKLYTGQML